MGILYQASDPMVWAIWLFVVFALMAFNEFGRTSVWGGVALFVVAPIVFTIFVWPHTAAPGNEYGTGNWFNWAKTYSALAGCVGFMALRFVKWRGADGREVICMRSDGRCVFRRSFWRSIFAKPWCATFRCIPTACGTVPSSTTCG